MLYVISVFENIRDIPYRIPLSESEENNCCAGKMIRLKFALEEKGYYCRYRVCSFNWSETNLPKRILEIPHDDSSTHVYLEVYIEDKWINIDPTWDSGLSDIFQIAQWDGKSSTSIAVKPLKLFEDEESRGIMELGTQEEVRQDLKINGEFYRGLNDYLEEIRNK